MPGAELDHSAEIRGRDMIQRLEAFLQINHGWSPKSGGGVCGRGSD